MSDVAAKRDEALEKAIADVLANQDPHIELPLPDDPKAYTVRAYRNYNIETDGETVKLEITFKIR